MLTIFRTIVGSQAYGTSTPTSDVDYKGVYIQDNDSILGFDYKQQVEIGKDEVLYEVKRFLELLKTANPTVLELLYSPEDMIEVKTKEFDWILEHKEKFLTKKCLQSFGGYAVAQISKAKGLDKKMNWEKNRVERKDVLDFCYTLEGPVKQWLLKENKRQEFCGLVKVDHFRDTYLLYYDHLAEMKSDNPRFEGQGHDYKGIIGDDSNEVRLSSVPKYVSSEATLYFNREGYSTHCKDYREYQEWLEKRNTQRYVDNQGHGQKIDGKNLLHCRRLLDVAMEIPVLKRIDVRRPNADYLLSIRRGEVNLDDVIKQAEEDIKGLDEIYRNSDLPDEVNQDLLTELLLKIRHAR